MVRMFFDYLGDFVVGFFITAVWRAEQKRSINYRIDTEFFSLAFICCSQACFALYFVDGASDLISNPGFRI
ncbi:MAG: hypothetical protein BWY75_03825 [bacterium ADurb.Bin425]|nr:MAG: hypothetical protein BWY75_03825 [bacterium ADurb.Bin425]